MNKTIVVLSAVILLSSCYKEKPRKDRPVPGQKAFAYELKRTDYVKGTYKTFAYELRNGMLTVTRYSTNDRPPKVLYSRALSESQKAGLGKLLVVLDAADLKKDYINQNIDGEGHSVYYITIDGRKRRVYVYFVSVPVLERLDKFIEEVLPPERNGWHDPY